MVASGVGVCFGFKACLAEVRSVVYDRRLI